jgi:syntaxin 6
MFIAAIVEKNPSRFRLNSAEVVQRRFFVQQTRDEIGNIKEKLQIMRGQDFDQSAKKVIFLVTMHS